MTDQEKLEKIRKKAEAGDVAGSDVLWLIAQLEAPILDVKELATKIRETCCDNQCEFSMQYSVEDWLRKHIAQPAAPPSGTFPIERQCIVCMGKHQCWTIIPECDRGKQEERRDG